MTVLLQQLKKAEHADGFIAALDQSGGSTPKALQAYGVSEDSYSDEAQMFDQVHQMRTRIMTNEAFHGDKILAAILFENTMQREVEGLPTARYLWEKKNIIPILKVDKGLDAEENDVQLMKPNPGLETLLEQARVQGIFGTKMRSVIKLANAKGIAEVVAQQFETAQIILANELVPIIEPEVDIHSPDKSSAETMLKHEITAHLQRLSTSQRVMLKLTLPNTVNLYQDCGAHPNCLRMAALSGGYSRDEACALLAKNTGMIASFSRALSEGLAVQQSDAEFTATLRDSVHAIAVASAT